MARGVMRTLTWVTCVSILLMARVTGAQESADSFERDDESSSAGPADSDSHLTSEAPGSAVEEPSSAEPTPAADPPSTLTYGATGRVVRPEAGARRLTEASSRNVPGALGDPFRVIDTLPGVATVLSGLPYVVIRGAPPATNLYSYDGIAIPTLFHLALGPAVIHPRMLGAMRLYSGAAPAQFGRSTGGVIMAEGPADPRKQVEGEIDIRLLDINAFLAARDDRTELAVSGRYGYPGPLLSVFAPEVELSYWDYQFRLATKIGAHDELSVVWFGSYDSLRITDPTARAPSDTDFAPDGSNPEGTDPEPFDQPSAPSENGSFTELQFHRAELRYARNRRGTEYGAALRFGYQESSLTDSSTEPIGAWSFTLGPRLWLQTALPVGKLRAGADFDGMMAQMRTMGFGSDAPQGACEPGSSCEEPIPEPDLRVTSDPDDWSKVAGDLNQARNRAQAGAYVSWQWSPLADLRLDVGARLDLWFRGAHVDVAADPRLRVTWKPLAEVETHLALGMAHQPANFFIPVAGLGDLILDDGLQTAYQAEAGVAWDIGEGFRSELQLFVHAYEGMLFPDFLGYEAKRICQSAECDIKFDLRRDGLSYGAEVLLSRFKGEWVTGWLSYTLAQATMEHDSTGLDYTPQYDIRHILNTVLSFDFGKGWGLGARFHVRSGKAFNQYVLRELSPLRISHIEHRLPAFYRLDLEASYEWSTSWGRMRFSMEMLNATLSEEALQISCTDFEIGSTTRCETEYAPAIFAPNLSFRGTF